MAITCTKKFAIPFIDAQGEQRTAVYFPGQVIEDQEHGTWAKMTGCGEERGEQAPARTLESPENAMADLQRSGGATKETKAERKAREKAEREAAAAAQAETPTGGV